MIHVGVGDRLHPVEGFATESFSLHKDTWDLLAVMKSGREGPSGRTGTRVRWCYCCAGPRRGHSAGPWVRSGEMITASRYSAGCNAHRACP